MWLRLQLPKKFTATTQTKDQDRLYFISIRNNLCHAAQKTLPIPPFFVHFSREGKMDGNLLNMFTGNWENHNLMKVYRSNLYTEQKVFCPRKKNAVHAINTFNAAPRHRGGSLTLCNRW